MNFYLVDHHPLMSEGLARLLRNLRPRCQIVPLQRMSQLNAAVVIHGDPHLIVFDLLVPGVKAAETIAVLRQDHPSAAIVVFSNIRTDRLEHQCMEAGGDLFLTKNAKVSVIHRELRQVLTRRFPAEQAQLRVKPMRITSRQAQLLHTIEVGMSNADIARVLSLSPHTIKVHLWRLFQRFQVSNRLQLVRFAHENGLF